MDTLRFKLYLCLALAFFCAGESLSIGVVNWQQGTPQRAGSQTILMWQGYPGAVKYTLTRKEVRSGRLDTWETIAPLYIDRKFDPAQNYDYHIIAYSSDGRPIAVSDTVTLQAERPLKAPVCGGSHQDGGEAFLIWDSDPRAKYHNIFRRQAGGEPKLIASVQQGKYVDKNIIPGLEYVYHLVSVGATGKESPQSDELVFVYNGHVSYMVRFHSLFCRIKRILQTHSRNCKICRSRARDNRPLGECLRRTN